MKTFKFFISLVSVAATTMGPISLLYGAQGGPKDNKATQALIESASRRQKQPVPVPAEDKVSQPAQEQENTEEKNSLPPQEREALEEKNDHVRPADEIKTMQLIDDSDLGFNDHGESKGHNDYELEAAITASLDQKAASSFDQKQIQKNESKEDAKSPDENKEDAKTATESQSLWRSLLFTEKEGKNLLDLAVEQKKTVEITTLLLLVNSDCSAEQLSQAYSIAIFTNQDEKIITELKTTLLDSLHSHVKNPEKIESIFNLAGQKGYLPTLKLLADNKLLSDNFSIDYIKNIDNVLHNPLFLDEKNFIKIDGHGHNLLCNNIDAYDSVERSFNRAAFYGHQGIFNLLMKAKHLLSGFFFFESSSIDDIIYFLARRPSVGGCFDEFINSSEIMNIFKNPILSEYAARLYSHALDAMEYANTAFIHSLFKNSNNENLKEFFQAENITSLFIETINNGYFNMMSEFKNYKPIKQILIENKEKILNSLSSSIINNMWGNITNMLEGFKDLVTNPDWSFLIDDNILGTIYDAAKKEYTHRNKCNQRKLYAYDFTPVSNLNELIELLEDLLDERSDMITESDFLTKK